VVIDSISFPSSAAESLDGPIPYPGPDYEDLSPELKDSFHEYLTSDLSIDSDFVAFIAMMSDYKEQEAYLVWLSGFRDFL